MVSIAQRLAQYAEIKHAASERYRTFLPTPCPAFNGDLVHFTAEGFNHLVYPQPKKERNRTSQILRFDMLERAKILIETATTFQEYDEGIQYRKVNRRGKHVEQPILVKMWGFVAIIKGFRIKVVVIQRGNSKKEFLSVAPAWFTRQYRDIKLIQNSTGKGLAHEDDEEVLKNAAVSDVL